MGKKARTTLTIDAEVLKKAHEIGLNVSQFCENALKEAIEALTQRKQQTKTNGGYIDTRSASRSAIEWTGRDLNPRLPPISAGHAKAAYALTTTLSSFMPD